MNGPQRISRGYRLCHILKLLPPFRPRLGQGLLQRGSQIPQGRDRRRLENHRPIGGIGPGRRWCIGWMFLRRGPDHGLRRLIRGSAGTADAAHTETDEESRDEQTRSQK